MPSMVYRNIIIRGMGILGLLKNSLSVRTDVLERPFKIARYKAF